ncbi:hypothetical protein Y695_03900 [Hydrogenophaga sp. T4]|nr:hypothetical protein Y695_03900 [Hydrogenophaga sp. T4]
MGFGPILLGLATLLAQGRYRQGVVGGVGQVHAQAASFGGLDVDVFFHVVGRALLVAAAGAGAVAVGFDLRAHQGDVAPGLQVHRAPAVPVVAAVLEVDVAAVDALADLEQVAGAFVLVVELEAVDVAPERGGQLHVLSRPEAGDAAHVAFTPWATRFWPALALRLPPTLMSTPVWLWVLFSKDQTGHSDPARPAGQRHSAWPPAGRRSNSPAPCGADLPRIHFSFF